ncbi:MAG: ROK family protein [Geminicoccaceae bacterium]|nr:ROK family protein [Geminicoccaceae bacterium]MCS7266795.1 ROK family protein [Geminicoccaceae bacterium]MCX7629061.1 ROK family protein [Geminicoccaceae bacterium]MDW8341586.1 ROK family protein [Geminicoccaceae bacterium]
MELAFGIDLGGTKIEILGLDGSGRERWRRRVPTPREDYAATVEAMARLVEEAEAALEARGTVGVGHPGAVSPASGLIKNANSTWLNGRPLHRDLAARLDRPVVLANDANCLALSEAVDGAGAGAEVVFAVILGTGVGGGIAVRGRVLEGANAIAGEWGHNPLPWPRPDELPGPRCWCGLSGCLEAWLSGPGLAADHERITGAKLEGPEIVARAQAGDAAARATLERWFDRLARGLACVINLLDPEVVVLGGGLSRVPRLYEAVPARWGRWVFSDSVATRLAPAAHGDSSGVRGAAWLGRGDRGGLKGIRVAAGAPDDRADPPTRTLRNPG